MKKAENLSDAGLSAVVRMMLFDTGIVFYFL